MRIRRCIACSVGLLLAFAACGGGEPSGAESSDFSSQSDALTVCAAGPTLNGVDVSVYQHSINWGQVAGAGVSWGYAKATESTTYRDPTFPANWAGMPAHGITRGAYHFFHPDVNGTAQADFFLNYVGAIGAGDLPPMLDWEVSDGASGATASANAQAFINEVQARTGRRTVIYTAPGIWAGFHAANFGGNPLWDADWLYCHGGGCCPVMPSGWSNWVFWQWSDRGSVPGIPATVDLDVFNGDASALAALAGGGAQTCGGPTGIPPTPPGCGRISEGYGLGPGTSVQACGGCFSLNMQTDGNLVLYRNNGTALWSSGTSGRGGKSLFMQTDGNGVLYSDRGCPLWASNTAGRGSFMALQDDGNVVVYTASGAAVWASNTDVCPGGCQCLSPLSIAPTSASTAPRGRVGFAANGGSGGYQWSILSGPSGGSISGSGVYTAGPTGNVTDVVKVVDSFGHGTTANVTVGPPISLAPLSSMTPPHGSLNFSATGGDGHYTWSIPSNASGGSITTSGVYSAGSTGSVTDTIQVVDSVGNSATAKVTVGPGLAITPATAMVVPRGGTAFTVTGGSGSGYAWSVTAPSGGTITPEGAYTAGATGSVIDTVQAIDSLGNTATVQVQVGPGVSISPQPSVVPPSGTVVFSASGGSGTGYTWSLTSAPSGGAITSAGVYKAGPTGSATDFLQVVDSLGNTASFEIQIGPDVSITPAVSAVSPRSSIAFTAQGGSGAGYTWTLTSTPSGGTITSSGQYTAGSTGNVIDVVQAVDSLGNVAVARVEVGPGLSVTPTMANVPPHGSITFRASGGSIGHYLWSMLSAPSGGSITSAGVYTAGSLGGVTDVVKVADAQGNIALVQVSVGAGLAITPAAVTVAPRQGASFFATGGSGLSYTWSLPKAPSGGTIDSSGRYSAGPAGNVIDTVQVTDSLGNVGQVEVTVGPGVSVSPASTAVPPQGSVSFSVSGGSGVGYTWSFTANGSGGTLTSGGVYKAGSTPNQLDSISVTDSLGNSATAQVKVGPAISISPASGITAPPRGTVTFSAMGGAGAGFSWSIPSNLSGGSITSAGAYTAGPTGNVSDTVQVSDPLGNIATVLVNVGPGLTITPPAAMLPPMSTLPFAVTGGSGAGYSWSMLTNASGGAITAGGSYTSGPTASVVDVVSVTDSLGNIGTAQVTISAGVSIWPVPTMVPPRGNVAFQASGGSGTGYVWSLAAGPSRGSITSTGQYTAGATPGVTDVVTVVDSVGNTASVQVPIGPGVSITPAQASVPPQGSLFLSASGGSGQGFTWTLTEAPSGGSVTSDGTYTAGSVGDVADTAQVTDSLGNSASVVITVSASLLITPSTSTIPPQGTVAFAAAGGSGTGYVWSIDSNSSGATISQDGLYTAGSTGGVVDRVQVTDSAGNVALADVAVGPGVSVTPSPAQAAPRQSVTFAASGGSGDGYIWSLTMAPSGGNITKDGLYTAGATGNVTDVVEVTDSFGNVATAQVTVGPELAISPASASIKPGDRLVFTATGGTGTGFVWSLTASPSGGSIGSDGVYTAGAVGDVTDTVRVVDSAGNSASADVKIGAAASTPPHLISAPQGCGCSGEGAPGSLALAGMLLGRAWLARRRRFLVRL